MMRKRFSRRWLYLWRSGHLWLSPDSYLPYLCIPHLTLATGLWLRRSLFILESPALMISLSSKVLQCFRKSDTPMMMSLSSELLLRKVIRLRFMKGN
nr:hypothetical protein Iba_chr14eCG4690 [Ipomoea batatas]